VVLFLKLARLFRFWRGLDRRHKLVLVCGVLNALLYSGLLPLWEGLALPLGERRELRRQLEHIPAEWKYIDPMNTRSVAASAQASRKRRMRLGIATLAKIGVRSVQQHQVHVFFKSVSRQGIPCLTLNEGHAFRPKVAVYGAR
jgi:type II secretory pathway component PulM